MTQTTQWTSELNIKLTWGKNHLKNLLKRIKAEEIEKYEYITGEEILLPDQTRIIEKAKFTYSRLGKAVEKQTKIVANQCEKQ